MQYVFWKIKMHDRNALKNSSVHIADPYTNKRTECNTRVPDNPPEICRLDASDLTKIPADLHFCSRCFAKVKR